MMHMRLMVAMFLSAVAAVAAAESLSDWLVRELTAAMDDARVEILPERRAALFEEAVQQAQDHDLADVHPCLLDAFLDYLVPETVDNAARANVPMNAVRFTFVFRLISALHSPSYDVLEPEQVSLQLNAFAAAFRENLEESVGHFMDSALLDEAERGLSSELHAQSTRCTSYAYKLPLPEEDFKALLEEVRHASLEYQSSMRWLLDQQRLEAGDLTEVEREHRANLEAMANRMGFSSEGRALMLQWGLPRMRAEDTVAHLIGTGRSLLHEIVSPTWGQHAEDTFHAPGDREIRQARITAALEAAGAGVEASLNLKSDRGAPTVDLESRQAQMQALFESILEDAGRDAKAVPNLFPHRGTPAVGTE